MRRLDKVRILPSLSEAQRRVFLKQFLESSLLHYRGTIRKLVTLVSGTLGAQLITIASLPFITRLFDPSAFGLLALFMSLTAILTPFLSLQLDAAIPLPKSMSESVRIARASTLTALSLMPLTLALLFAIKFAANWGITLLDEAPYWLLMLVAVTALLGAWEKTSQHALLRRSQYRTLALSALSMALTMASIRLALGPFYNGTEVLVISVAFGYLSAIALPLVTKRLRLSLLKSKPATSKTLKQVRQQQQDFVKFRTPQQLLNTLSQNLPALVLVSLFGPAVGGLYALAERIVRLPGRLLSNSIYKLSYQQAAERSHKNLPLAPQLKKATLSLALFGLVPFAILAWLSPMIFGLVFGEQWQQSGDMAQWLVIWIYGVFINTPAIATIPVLKQHKRYLIFNLVGTPCRLAALLLGAKLYGYAGAIAGFAIAGVLYNLIVIADVYQRVALFDKQHSTN